MTTPADSASRTIVFGVTIDYQLRYHEGLYQRLADVGWEVHLVAGAGPIGDRLSKCAGVTVHRLSMERTPNPVADMRSLWAWYRLLRTIRPGAVVVGTPKAGLLGSVAARLTRVPVRVYELHGLRLESAQGLQRRILRLLEKLACRAATRVVAVGRSLLDRALAEGLAPEPKIQVIGGGSPNGVDVEHFGRAVSNTVAQAATRKALNLAPQSPVVTFVGRLTADKGLDALAEAMVKVEQRTGAHLLVLGAVDDESGRASVSRLRAKLTKAVFAGDVEDVAPYLAISDVFCLPSRREGLPTVVLEAFASRVPVVATRATGIIDLVDDGRTGRLVPVDAPDALCSALIEALKDDEQSRRMAEEALARVEQTYRSSTVQSAWVKTLTRLVLGASVEGEQRDCF